MKVALTIFWLMLIIPIIWGEPQDLQRCEESSDCQLGEFCDTTTGNSVCSLCLSCEKRYNRLNSSRNSCAQKVEDCGDCRPGYREEVLTENKTSEKCSPIESNSSTSVPALSQLKNTEDEGQLSGKLIEKYVLVVAVCSVLECVLLCLLLCAYIYVKLRNLRFRAPPDADTPPDARTPMIPANNTN
ncbi:hypothetical protein TCAL_15682 [Tigriopus californicus]|uniref:TNFR-Cys domain-containing protein n=1 Tax=Tigriopus californicus TaxID=6832 RepID=A0A553PBT8_TIGCA|nr:uncharacterized protein LOC131876967 [Tigriopus californicus]TRY75142.1 hypothetical protein TCAL_15682 [Tigriopus californicus]